MVNDQLFELSNAAKTLSRFLGLQPPESKLPWQGRSGDAISVRQTVVSGLKWTKETLR
jgi:hypothetical protein